MISKEASDGELENEEERNQLNIKQTNHTTRLEPGRVCGNKGSIPREGRAEHRQPESAVTAGGCAASMPSAPMPLEGGTAEAAGGAPSSLQMEEIRLPPPQLSLPIPHIGDLQWGMAWHAMPWHGGQYSFPTTRTYNSADIQNPEEMSQQSTVVAAQSTSPHHLIHKYQQQTSSAYLQIAFGENEVAAVPRERAD